MTSCLLNIDLGELLDEPDELYALANIANIACGGHAGDDDSMQHALALCKQNATRAGAHPSYVDRANFGRQYQDIKPGQLRTVVAEQCRALAAHAATQGVTLAYVKPHGALYHAADKSLAIANAVLAGAIDALGTGICVIGPAGGALEAAARSEGIAFAREDFADRVRCADGSLKPRTQTGAVSVDPEAARMLALKLLATGLVDTLCVHGDTPNAVAIAHAVRAALDELSSHPVLHDNQK